MPSNHVEEFVVPEYNELYLQDTVKNVPYDYYCQNNVIIHPSKKEYFYHDNWTKCGTGWKVTNPPKPIDFKQNPLIKFEKVKDVLDYINKKNNPIKLVILASHSDTIRNKAYFELKQGINEAKDIQLIATRKSTSDEENAIANNLVVEH